jgi:hypothetical protein
MVYVIYRQLIALPVDAASDQQQTPVTASKLM